MTPDLSPRRTLARVDRWPRTVRAVVKTGVDAVLMSVAFLAACALHIGGQSPDVRERQWRLWRENIRRFVAGEPLLCVVDKATGF